jgi:tRNA (Thr-GGU) A37 N-methylase
MVKPYLDDSQRGVFATRAPRRPNAVGISVVRLVSIEGCTLHIEDVDIADCTPLLDIKPYVPEFDSREAERTGWLAGKAEKAAEAEADERFK